MWTRAVSAHGGGICSCSAVGSIMAQWVRVRRIRV